MGEFIPNAGRNRNRRKEAWEYFNGFNQDKIVEWTGVSNRCLHLCAEASERFKIPLKVLIGIFEFNTTVLEKGVHFHTRLKSEQLPQLSMGNLVLSVRFRGQCFESGARKITTGARKCFAQFLGQTNSYVLHCCSLPKIGVKSTPAATTSSPISDEQKINQFMVNHGNSFGLGTFSSALALLDFRNWLRRRNLRPRAPRRADHTGLRIPRPTSFGGLAPSITSRTTPVRGAGMCRA